MPKLIALICLALVMPCPAALNCAQSSSLQACHDALPDEGGRMVIPAGTYALTSQLSITKPNVTIEGDGAGNTVIQRGQFESDAPAVAILAPRVAVRDCTFDGNGVATSWALVSFYGGASDGVLERSEIRNPDRVGLAIHAPRVIVVDNAFVGPGLTGNGNNFAIWFDSDSVEDLLIRGNTIRGMAANAMFGSGERIRIQGNTISDNHHNSFPGGGQIALDSAYDVLIQGNTIGPGGGPQVSGIELDGGAGPAGARIVIDGNTIRGQTWVGIVANRAGVTDLIVSDNVISNSGTAAHPKPGILIPADMSWFQISGNRIFDDRSTKAQTYGIEIQQGASNRYMITGNSLLRNKLGGLLDGGVGPSKIIDANLGQ